MALFRKRSRSDDYKRATLLCEVIARHGMKEAAGFAPPGLFDEILPITEDQLAEVLSSIARNESRDEAMRAVQEGRKTVGTFMRVQGVSRAALQPREQRINEMIDASLRRAGLA